MVSTSSRNDPIRPEPELLGIYLNDHLAGATAGVQLVRRLARSLRGTVVELEMLRLGIEGKASGWRTLRTVGAQNGRPGPQRLDDLIERARRQAAVVETLRVRAVSTVFGAPAAA